MVTVAPETLPLMWLKTTITDEHALCSSVAHTNEHKTLLHRLDLLLKHVSRNTYARPPRYKSPSLMGAMKGNERLEISLVKKEMLIVIYNKNSKPVERIEDREYYNDLPGKIPPDLNKVNNQSKVDAITEHLIDLNDRLETKMLKTSTNLPQYVNCMEGAIDGNATMESPSTEAAAQRDPFDMRKCFKSIDYKLNLLIFIFISSNRAFQ